MKLNGWTALPLEEFNKGVTFYQKLPSLQSSRKLKCKRLIPKFHNVETKLHLKQ